MNFSKEEYKSRLKKVQASMQEKGIELLISQDPSNMNYLTGYDAWSFYYAQCVIVHVNADEPICLVEMIVRSLVDYPDEVSINETSGESIMILEITVSPEDVGKVIGKEGRIANAIRTVVKAAAAKLDKKVTVEILTQK